MVEESVKRKTCSPSLIFWITYKNYIPMMDIIMETEEIL